jgi:hypothetical protein
MLIRLFRKGAPMARKQEKAKQKQVREVTNKLVSMYMRKLGAHPMKRIEIDRQLSMFYHAVSSAYLTTFLYDLSLKFLPDSKVWKEAREKSEAEGLPKPKRTHARHWSDIYGITNLDNYLTKELEENHCHLYNQLLITLWAITEAKIDDVILSYVLAVPSVLKKEAFTNLKCTIGDMLGGTTRHKARLALRLYRESKGGAFKRGAERFNLMLDVVGLGGGIPTKVSQHFIEMSEIRHNLVHRNGVIDKKLALACPWMKLPENHRIGIDRSYILRLLMAIKFYIMEIDRRIMKSFNQPIPDQAEKLYQFYLSHFDEKIDPLPCPASFAPEMPKKPKKKPERSAS